MKLFYAPGACSLSPHIVFREAGIPVELQKVDLKAKKYDGGADYTKINAKGYVPALQLDSGQVLTEARCAARAETRQLRALSAAGVAEFHRHRAAQRILAAVQAQYAR